MSCCLFCMLAAEHISYSIPQSYTDWFSPACLARVMTCATQGHVRDAACLLSVLQADPTDAVEPSAASQPKLSWRERALLKKQQAEGS